MHRYIPETGQTKCGKDPYKNPTARVWSMTTCRDCYKANGKHGPFMEHLIIGAQQRLNTLDKEDFSDSTWFLTG